MLSLEFPMNVKRKSKYKTTSESLHDDETIYRIREEGRLNTVTRCYKLIDLFSGAGGLTLGFTETMGQVFQPVWAVYC